MRWWWLLGLLVRGAAQPAMGDEFRPAYLQLTQIDSSTYHVLRKLPSPEEATTLKVRPEFPHGTRVLMPVHGTCAKHRYGEVLGF